MWRGVRRRPSPQPLRILALLLSWVWLAATSALADPVLDEANDLKDGDACDAALPLYASLYDVAEPEVAGAARYNAALCLEELGRPEEARSNYDQLALRSTPGAPEIQRDALFRRALLDVVPGRSTPRARRDLARTRRLARGGLEKALVDLQLARLDSLDGRRPTRRLLVAGAALALAGDDEDRDRRGARLDWYRGEAALVRGTLFANEARRQALGLRGRAKVTSRIRARGEALKTAEGHFTDAVRAGRSPWAQQALRDLGRAWLETAQALDGLLLEAKGWTGRRPSPAEATALVLFLEPRIPAQVEKARQAFELCVQAEFELGGAPEVGAECRAQLAALAERGATPQ